MWKTILVLASSCLHTNSVYSVFTTRLQAEQYKKYYSLIVKYFILFSNIVAKESSAQWLDKNFTAASLKWKFFKLFTKSLGLVWKGPLIRIINFFLLLLFAIFNSVKYLSNMICTFQSIFWTSFNNIYSTTFLNVCGKVEPIWYKYMIYSNC